MNRTDAPKKQAVPFAVNGQREELLPTSPAGDNTASYDAGFPAVTMILKAAGGLPPKGQDMNQILFELSSLARWFSTGSINSYDATFSAEIGGYPKGAIVLGEDGNTRYMSTAEANTSDPNTDGAGWFNLSAGYLKTENNLSEIKGAGPDAVATALSNLGLGTAATKNVGTGTNQIPDMNSYGNSVAANGYQKLPSGVTIQWGSFAASATGGSVGTIDVTFPVAFPVAFRSINAMISTNDPSARFIGFDIANTNRSKVRFNYVTATTNSIYWIAVGY